MSSSKVEFTKENIDTYLRELGKEYRKQCGKKIPADLFLVGGAAVLINYGFRDMTTDIDAIIRAASGMKDAINRIGDEFDLPYGWLNADFLRTASYTPRITKYAERYRTFSNVLTVHTISAEYLIAVKLRSGRHYKRDLSDILGILAEHEKQNSPLTMDRIKKAVRDLYGDWEELPESSRQFIEAAMREGNFTERYAEVVSGETEARKLLIEFANKNQGALKGADINSIIAYLRNR